MIHDLSENKESHVEIHVVFVIKEFVEKVDSIFSDVFKSSELVNNVKDSGLFFIIKGISFNKFSLKVFVDLLLLNEERFGLRNMFGSSMGKQFSNLFF